MRATVIAAARSRSLRPYLGLVVFTAFTLALGLGLELQKHLHFEYRPHAGIVGWIHVHEYPKQQELVYFLLALLGPPLVIVLGWQAWIACATLAARWTRRPVERLLERSALASLPLLLIWYDIHHLDRSWVTGLALPIGLTIVAAVGGCLVLARKPLVVSPAPATAASALPEGAAPLPHSSAPHALVALAKYLALPIVVYVAAYSGNIHGRIDMFHEGERLAPLNSLLHGEVPFRDFYLQHGLFQDAYLGRLASATFGPTLEGVRQMQRILDPLAFVALYFLGLQIFRGGWITALLLALLASGASIGVFGRHTVGLISLAFVASQISRQHRGAAPEVARSLKAGVRESWRMILAGVTTSAAFWYSTEIGLYTLAAIGAFSVCLFAAPGSFRRNLPPLLGYGLGVLLGFGAVAVYLALRGALDDAIANTYVQCAYQIDTWGRAFPSLASVLEPLAESGLVAGWKPFVLSEGARWYAPVFVLMLTGGYLTYRWLRGDAWRSESCVQLLFLSLASAAFFRTALGRSDDLHMDFGATCAWLLLLFFVDRGAARLLHVWRSSSLPGKQRALLSAWVLVPSLALLWYAREVHFPPAAPGSERAGRKNSLLAGRLFDQAERPTTLERAGRIDIPAEQEAQIREVVAYIHANTAADEPIFDFSNQGAFYFFADRPSATRFDEAVYATTLDLQREVIATLERQQTRLVIFKTGNYADRFDGVPNEERQPLLAQYLTEHYEPAAKIRGTELLKRRP